MMSVSCKTGDLPCEYDICFADDMRFGVYCMATVLCGMRRLFQYLLYDPKLKSFRQGIQQEQKRIAVDTVCKSGIFCFQYFFCFFSDFFRWNAPCFNIIYYAFEPFCISGIQL